MPSSFGHLSQLQWSPDSWRHYPDSPGDERFLAQLQLLRAPPKNLGMGKYLDCIGEGVRRLAQESPVSIARRGVWLMSGDRAKTFWDAINCKPVKAIAQDDVGMAIERLKSTPISADPVGALQWQNALCRKLDIAQLSRPLHTIPNEIARTFELLRPWSKGGAALQHFPDLSKAPTWVQTYGALLQCGDASIEEARPAIQGMVQLMEDHYTGYAIAAQLCAQDAAREHPIGHAAAIAMVQAFAARYGADLSGAMAAPCFALMAHFLDTSSPTAPWILEAAGARVPTTAGTTEEDPFLLSLLNRVCPPSANQEIFLVSRLSAQRSMDAIYSVWAALPKERRRVHVQAAVERWIHVYITKPAPVSPDSEVLDLLEKELHALRPWPPDTLARFSSMLSNDSCSLALAKTMDERVETIATLDADTWLALWRQCLMPATPALEMHVDGGVFEDASPAR